MRLYWSKEKGQRGWGSVPASDSNTFIAVAVDMDHFWDVFVMKKGGEGKARTRAARAKGRSKERANEEKDDEEKEENEQSFKGRANAKRIRNQRI